MDIDLLFKIVVLIVLLGITIKVIKLISGAVFKIALILFVLLLLYKMFL
ncbi:hypothetical protein [Romboutsia maritimum]|nr:hypothetical protein [Romboutsia maritimum]